MKIGDKVYCINNKDEFCDDIDHDYHNSLQINIIFTIRNIYVVKKGKNEWVTEITENHKQGCEIYLELIEIDYLLFNHKRFLTSKQYRKLKLQKIDENR